jgi:hypothetical protein
MKRASIIFFLMLGSLISQAQETTYLGLYLQGSKLGYSSYRQTQEQLNGKPVSRNDSHTVLSAGLLGGAMQMDIQSVSWSDAKGRPIKMKFVTSSAGRSQILDAKFEGQKIFLDIVNNGAVTKKTLIVPAGGMIVDDPLTPIVLGKSAVGSKQSFYILDPTTSSLIKNDVVLKGPTQVNVKGSKVSATRIDVIDPRANTSVYLSSKGDLIKAEGPMGIEMIPETKEEALDSQPTDYRPSVDLAVVTSIKTDKPIKDPAALSYLKMRITGKDLSTAPSDDHQTLTGKGQIWTVAVHPPKLAASAGTTIAAAAKMKPEWMKPSLHIPSNSPEFKALAKKIVGGETNVKKAALKIKAYVQQQMHPNTGIGVLRDASEILKTKEGVCRDYAILTATILRAAGIPTKVASGLVNWDGNFYYHAWAEVWDGKRWLGIDSTTPAPQISAAHVKLSDGNVEEAFTFTFLDKVKIEVLEAKR